jgi:GntR family transcriptional regulator/MocR family aminotransferase
MRSIYHSRMKLLATGLRSQLPNFLEFQEPAGGTAIWVRTRDASTTTGWVKEAKRAGVVFDAGTAFTLNATAMSGARLGFACLDEHELHTALERLGTAARRI